MTSLPEVLWDYTKPGARTRYSSFHSDVPDRISPDETQWLHKFLFSTMDEVRLHFADKYAVSVLSITDIDDAAHFRHGVLRREMAAEISFKRQRDHAAHTLHNYILGWYIFGNCDQLREMFESQFKRRIGESAIGSVGSYFGNIWPFVSLLHDVGYLFEGALESLSTEIQSDTVRLGASVVQDYFHRRFWIETGINSVEDRRHLRDLTKIGEPNFASSSLAAVGDALRDLGDLEKVRQAVVNELRNQQYHIPKILEQVGGLSGDSFDLWHSH